jgi:hypothetical protein
MVIRDVRFAAMVAGAKADDGTDSIRFVTLSVAVAAVPVPAFADAMGPVLLT